MLAHRVLGKPQFVGDLPVAEAFGAIVMRPSRAAKWLEENTEPAQRGL
jgi:hypothetical protein